MMAVKVKRHPVVSSSPWRGIARLLGIIWWYLLPLLLFSLIPVAKKFPVVVEYLYSRVWYPIVAHTYGRVVSLIPFSLLETFILLTILAVLLFCFRGIFAWVRREELTYDLKKGAIWILRCICIILSLFMLFCGYNYYRLPFSETCGLVIRESSVQELFDLCIELGTQANLLRTQLPSNDYGVMQLSDGAFALSDQARNVFADLSKDYPVLPAYPITPKPILDSWAMSLMQITGVFCPVTFEANINVDAPDYTIPATMCHELAHSRGFMREDEANFIGYLACRDSTSAEFQYSGVMLGLTHAGNRLYSMNKDLFREYFEMISSDVRADLLYNNEYWAQFEGPVGDVSTAVNNTYLQLNAQEDGVHSYGRMVDLLLADYRARYNLA